MAAAFRDNLVSSVCPCAVVGYVGCEERFGVGLFIVAAIGLRFTCASTVATASLWSTELIPGIRCGRPVNSR